jgi:DNA processing protein
MTERDYLLALHRIDWLGPIRLEKLRSRLGSYEKVWFAKSSELHGLLPPDKLRLFNEFRMRTKPNEASLELDRLGMDTVTILDEDYPPLLREIHAPPAVLYYHGALPSAALISIVGTRRITPYGRNVTAELVRGLVNAGLGVVSGLAYGIDVAAHRATLDAGGIAAAVIASPVNRIQPTAHANIGTEIIDKGGTILSEYPPGTTTQRVFFPIRNRIIAGLCRAVIVVEAGEKSGALITASQALSENRDVFSVPGNVNSESSKGTNALIRMGAALIRNSDDVLEALGYAVNAKPRKAPVPTGPIEESLFRALAEPSHFDKLVEKTGLPPQELGSLLTLMEVEGKIRHLGANMYSL